MTMQEAYSGAREKWPQVLREKEREAILQAARAKEGEDAKRSLLIIGAMLYLGLPVLEAAKVRFCTACGDAVEDTRRKAFLHIPSEYHNIFAEALESRCPVHITDQLVTCTQKEAENAVKSTFDSAGISHELCFMKLRRTSAWLHHENKWTPDVYIERWFKEIEYIKEKQGQYFYREKTDADIQAEIDAVMERLTPLV